MRGIKDLDLNGREGDEILRVVEGGETVIRICCMRKESVFSQCSPC